MKNPQERTPVDVARHKATLLGKAFAQRGLTLSRAEQLSLIAYLEGEPSWHVLSAKLSQLEPPFGALVTAYCADSRQETWRVQLVTGEFDEHGSHLADLPEAAIAPLTRHRPALERLLVAEETLAAFIDGVPGCLVEQEFVCQEVDGADYETCEQAIERLREHLLPRLAKLQASVHGARLGIVNDANFVWNGRPTCWLFLPAQHAMPKQASEAVNLLREFAYPEGRLN